MTEHQTNALKALTGERSLRAIALRAGIEPSTLTRQISSGIRAETVIEISRHYEISPIHALVTLGFLTESELALAANKESLSAANEEELAEEILVRVRSKQAAPAPTTPFDPLAQRQTDYDLVSHPYTDETGELMDE